MVAADHVTRAHGRKLWLGRFRTDIRKAVFTEVIEQHQSMLFSEVVESPYLEVFNI